MKLRHSRHTPRISVELKRFLPMLLFGPLVISFMSVVLRSQYFALTSIRCELDQQPCPDYITAELEKMLGRSFFFTDLEEATAQLITKAPFLTQPTYKKTLPGSVTFRFQSAQPHYLLQDSAGQVWVVDAEGFVTTTPFSPSDSLVTIQLSPQMALSLQPREKIEPSIHNGLWQTIQALRTYALPLTSLTLISAEELRAIDANGRTVVFAPSDAHKQLGALSYLSKQFSFSSLPEPITEIDVRYGHVILRTQEAVSSEAATTTHSSPTVASDAGLTAPLR